MAYIYIYICIYTYIIYITYINTDLSDCEELRFCDSHCKHFITFHDQKALSLNFKSIRLQMLFKIDVLKNLEDTCAGVTF